MNTRRDDRRIGFWLVLAFSLTAASALAEDLVQFGPDGVPRTTPLWKDVTITDVVDGKVNFKTLSGTQQSVEASSVAKIISPKDPLITQADEAFIAGKFDAAIDAYTKTIDAGATWKVQWVAPRLTAAAQKTNRFDAALAAYVALARVDPTAATTGKPKLPAKGSAFLDEAARTLQSSARGAGNDAQRQALLSLLLDVQLAQGDQADAEATIDQLLKLAGDSASDPKLAALVGEIRLGQARVALEAKRYADVAKAIAVAAPRLTEPHQQAEAFFLRGSAALAQAKPGDKPALLDAALDFMRVVAHFDDVDGRPFVAQSLLAASDALEQAGEPLAARAACASLIAEMPDSPLAAAAKSRVARLDNAKSPPTR